MTTGFRSRRLPAALAALLIAGALASAQSQGPTRDTPARVTPAGTGSISGTVVLAGETPAQPIRRAIVTLTGTGIATSVQAITDDAGRFAFGGLPSGRFSLTAEKPAFLKSYFGSTRMSRPPGMPIAITAGQLQSGVVIPMARGAVIAGRVTDELGVPIASAQVSAQLVTIVNGERRSSAPPVGVSMVTTDDQGAFRLYGLLPGDYVVRSAGGGGLNAGGSAHVVTPDELDRALRPPVGGIATTSPTPTPLAQYARLTTYFPNVTASSAATTVVLDAGADRSGVDIVSRLSRVVRVEGLALQPDGQPASNISVGLANVTAGSIWSSLGAVRADAQGRFTVTSLTAGSWLLFGRAAPPGTASDGQYPWWGQTEVVVGDQDVSGVVLAFAPGSIVNGRLQFNGAGPTVDPARLRVTLTPLPAIPGTGQIIGQATPAADGSFAFAAVPPGRYRVNVSASGAWALQSGVANGREALDAPLEVFPGQDVSLALTMTDQVTEISGLLMDQLDRPAPEYSIIVFSANRAHWGIAPRRTSGVVRVGSDGRYRVVGLPAGDYVLSVVTDADPNATNDPTFLEDLLRLGVPITLVEGEKRRQDFKIGVGDPDMTVRPGTVRFRRQ